MCDHVSTTTLADATEPLALAIDIGTSSVRAILYDARGSIVADHNRQVSYEVGTSLEGESTFDADQLRELAEQCVDACCASLLDRRVKCVGVSCFWHGLLGLDERGRPVTPIYYWSDRRSAGQVDKLRATLDEAQWRVQTGSVFHSSYWPAKLLWIRETEPDRFRTTRRWTSAADYFARTWLHEDWMSLCMASGTGMVSLTEGDWIPKFGKTFQVDPDTLPPIVDRFQIGRLTPKFASRWRPLAGADWFPALGDGACANVGCGAINRRRVAMTLGTSGAVRLLDHRPMGTELPLYDDLWVYRLDREFALYGAAISNGGLMLDWTLDLIGDPDGALRDDAEQLPPASHGLTILPFLAGERAPIWNDDARGVLSGLSAATTRPELLLAATEAVAYRLAAIYDALAPLAETDHDVVANGAALLKSELLLQTVASSINHSIIALDADLEASARGAAILSLTNAEVGLEIEDFSLFGRIVEPEPGRIDIYQRERKRQEDLLALFDGPGSPWRD